MKKSNLIGGIVCLAIAGLLTVLNLRLPEDSMMFMVGGSNMPWTPPVVLGIIGIILLVTWRRQGRCTLQQKNWLRLMRKRQP